MTIGSLHGPNVFSRAAKMAWAATVLLLSSTVAMVTPALSQDTASAQTLRGKIESGGKGLSSYDVSLYITIAGDKTSGKVAGTAKTNKAGEFEITYELPPAQPDDKKPILFAIAENGPAMLAAVFDADPTAPSTIVVNERTTVAAAAAFTRFIDGRTIGGNTYGMINAVKMAANMADPKTGAAGEIISKEPNGTLTSTYSKFNSMANILAGCVASKDDCAKLFKAATPPGGSEPGTVLQAVANMTKYPAHNLGDLFVLSLKKNIYEPALASGEKPDSWLLFLKFTGGFYSKQDAGNLMNGPGSLAIDEKGYAWINDNYVPQRVGVDACAGLRLLKFYPWGESFPGSPYFGGGLSGAGFGIALDARGDVWVANYGFEAPDCADGTVPADPAKKIPATHNSMSLFSPDGTPKSPAEGYTNGKIWWPQGTEGDPKGNIWVGNCGNDSATFIPNGDPTKAVNFPLPGAVAAQPDGTVMPPASPNVKPFGLAVDPTGRAWIAGNKANKVYAVSPDGTVEIADTKDLLSHPMGIAGDSEGNMWVSSSAIVDIPCVGEIKLRIFGGTPSVVLIPADGSPAQKFTGGGLSIPWGNAVDGNGTVWVFNFGLTVGELIKRGVSSGFKWPNTGVSRLCGVDTSKCPKGSDTVGAAISPDTGYTSDALERLTGGTIDQSGNLWLINNWRIFGPLELANPGANSIVIVPGAAAPIKTPVLGPPQSID